MANYKETNISGTSYIRAKEVVIRNELDGTKGAAFIEEQIINFDGATVKQPYEGIFEPFTPENQDTAFPMLDANGNETGETKTYSDVYEILSSLYYFVATKRDAQNSEE